MYVGRAPVEVSGELLEIYRSTCPGARLRGLHRWQDMQRRKKRSWAGRSAESPTCQLASTTGRQRGGGFAGREGGNKVRW